MQDGRFVPADADEVLTVLMNNARTQFGNDLNDDEEAAIRLFYIPVANLIADVQEDISLVLDASQLDFAEGKALDLLTTLIGVYRKPAKKASGTVTFSRESAAGVDYTIPKGTVVQTDAIEPIKFETTETTTLTSGTTSIADVAVEAVETGPDGNLGTNALTVMPDPPAGIEEVTNAAQTSGGNREENDDELRDRAKDELSNGMRGTAKGVRNELLKTENVQSVSLFINDSDVTDGNGLKSHHFEAVVEGGADADIGQTIFDSKGAGDGTQGGVHGTLVSYDAEIGNGQTHPVEFSRPTDTQIYVDMSISVTENYGGDEDIRDEIIQYIGGILSSGNNEDGELRVGDDVIYSQIQHAIMSVNGVYDVTSLTVGTSASPTGTSNISISNTELATGNATDGSITISTTQV
jgi:uncharacterized phage protein gp47/JayE